MRRAGIALAAAAVAWIAAGCSRLGVGLWADSDRGQSVAAIASIELPPEPAVFRNSAPAVEKAGKAETAAADEWDVPAHVKPVATPSTPDIPKAAKPKEPPKPSKVVEVETWTPKTEPGTKPAEFGAEAGNYGWIQGRVAYVKIAGQRVWKIRFAPYDRIDKFGGSFVLEGKLPDDLKDGDLVRISGSPSSIQDARQARYLCEQITFLDRAAKMDR
jgi:hypothetical protein